MLFTGLLASVEHGLNRVLRLDSTALARLAHLTGKVIAVDCRSPAVQLFILPSDEGLLLAAQWAADADCTLRAPASSLLHLALSKDKTAVLHGPQVDLEGDSHVLMELAAILQDLELGRLAGVSGPAVVNWEKHAGRIRLRKATAGKLQEIRGLKKRDVAARLGQGSPKKAKAKRRAKA